MPHLAEQESLLFGGALALGDVARHLRRADDRAVRTSDRRYAERNIDQSAVLVPAQRLVMIDLFAAAHAREDIQFRVGPVPSVYHVDRTPDGFLCRIAEKTLAAAVPTCDVAVQVHRINRVL